ncbi:MAG: DUF4199 domain-containing protein [Muribaculaceae bacterium]|nr:DUF4199 domain-containing protein [Muribaculaceae bacterium]
MPNNDVRILKQASDYGAYLGALLSLLFFAVVYSSALPALSFLAIAMLLAIPFFIFFVMKRLRRKAPDFWRMSALWMLGILIFIFGGIILAAVAYIFLQFIDPDFIYRQLGAAIEIYKHNPDLINSQSLAVLTKMYESGNIPSAIQSAMSTLWSVSFFGSILSLIEAAIVSISSKRNQNISPLQ